jgi:protein subunit release factor A
MKLNPTDFIVETYPSKKRHTGWFKRPDKHVKITHTPTGISVVSEDDSLSVHGNASRAWEAIKDTLAKPTEHPINLRY